MFLGKFAHKRHSTDMLRTGCGQMLFIERSSLWASVTSCAPGDTDVLLGKNNHGDWNSLSLLGHSSKISSPFRSNPWHLAHTVGPQIRRQTSGHIAIPRLTVQQREMSKYLIPGTIKQGYLTKAPPLNKQTWATAFKVRPLTSSVRQASVSQH